MLHICGVSKTFGEWHQKTNKTEDTNKLTLLGFKIIYLYLLLSLFSGTIHRTFYTRHIY
jgi:hypothetical protein